MVQGLGDLSMSLSVINRGASILAVAVLVLILAPTGEATELETLRFELFAGCEPVRLSVEEVPPDAVSIGLTKQVIQTTVEDRLRAFRLYNRQSFLFGPHLYVRVSVVGAAFSIDLEYKKWVRELESERLGVATTWDTGVTGTHVRNASYILSGVSALLEDFLVEYLRANALAC